MHFNFVASNQFNVEYFKDYDRFLVEFPDFQPVALNNKAEIQLLAQLLGIDELNWIPLERMIASQYCDISSYKLPEFTRDEFDEFYESWITQSKRESNMDKYGSLIFLQGLARRWNKLIYRLIVVE